jgi:hypothetical protein
MSRNFKNQAAADRFAEDLLNTLTDTYYVWTAELPGRFPRKVRKARNVRFREIPAKAEEVFTGQSISYAIQLLRDKGWKNVSNHHNFKEAAEEVGFTVREFYGVSVVTL